MKLPAALQGRIYAAFAYINPRQDIRDGNLLHALSNKKGASDLNPQTTGRYQQILPDLGGYEV
jgi:hypothetical protein